MVSFPNEYSVEQSFLSWVDELGAYQTWTIGRMDEIEAQVTRHLEALNYE